MKSMWQGETQFHSEIAGYCIVQFRDMLGVLRPEGISTLPKSQETKAVTAKIPLSTAIYLSFEHNIVRQMRRVGA